MFFHCSHCEIIIKNVPKWVQTYEWLTYNAHLDKAFCSVCKSAYKDLKLPYVESAPTAFISGGFSNWKKAIEKFKTHESSQVHLKAVIAILAQRSDTNISDIMSQQTQQCRMDARHSLVKIFETIPFWLSKEYLYEDIPKINRIL